MLEFLITVTVSIVGGAALTYKMYVLPMRESLSTLTADLNLLKKRTSHVTGKDTNYLQTTPPTIVDQPSAARTEIGINESLYVTPETGGTQTARERLMGK